MFVRPHGHCIRYEQEGKLAKTLESEKLLKEAEEARLALAARKEQAAAEARYDCQPAANTTQS